MEYHTGREEGCVQRKDGTNVRRREEIQVSGLGSVLTVWSCSCHGYRPPLSNAVPHRLKSA